VKMQIPGAVIRQQLNFGDATGLGKISGEYFSLSAGVDTTPLFVGLQGNSCQCPHWGYVLQGQITTTDEHGAQDADQILGAFDGESEEPLPSHHPLIAALQQWRAGVARDMGVPAYTVLSDSALRSIATQRPCTPLELAKVPGVGPRALAKFGDSLLEIAGQEPRPIA